MCGRYAEEDGDVPPEYLIPKHELTTLCTEAAKLKSAGAMAVVPTERLVRLMHILEKNIRDGAKVTPMVDEVSCAGAVKVLMHIHAKNIRDRAKVTPIVDEVSCAGVDKELMHILEKNIRDRAKVTPIVTEVSCAWVDKELMHILEKNIRDRAKVTPIVNEVGCAGAVKEFQQLLCLILKLVMIITNNRSTPSDVFKIESIYMFVDNNAKSLLRYFYSRLQLPTAETN